VCYYENENLYLTLQRGVSGTAHHRVNITCCGVTSTVCHAARSLIGLYLDNLGSKCNQPAWRLFVKELALL